MNLFKEFVTGLSHLLFPKLCEGCRLPLIEEEDVLCLSCLQALPHTNYQDIPDNEAAMRFAGRFPFEQVTALAPFVSEGLLQHLMHRLKYAGKEHIGVFLGRQLGYDLLKSDWINTIDVIVPVPLFPRKEAIRGFNQSCRIAKGLEEVLGIRVLEKALKKIHPTASQINKNREQRLANVKGTFELNTRTALRGKHILLVDDVLTTGATLEAAANVLLKVEGVRISIAAIGIASA